MSRTKQIITELLEKLSQIFDKSRKAPRNVYASQLGYYLDGWSDLIEGMGPKVNEVRVNVLEQLKGRNMPDVTVEEVRMEEGFLSDQEYRNYTVTLTFPSVTTTIYIAEYGRDLFASWRTYIRTTFNSVLMKSYLTFSFLIGFLGYFTYSILTKTDILNIFVGRDLKETLALLLTANFGAIFFPLSLLSILIFIIILFLASIAGFIMKQNLFAFILKEPSLFDKEDIIAMSLTVHKTILRSLDKVGIDMSKLRLKGEFKSGRRGESV